jgi:hypothetical protein
MAYQPTYLLNNVGHCSFVVLVSMSLMIPVLLNPLTDDLHPCLQYQLNW